MPDINLDSLFIVGLILASLVGKIFKKKEPAEKEKPIQEDEPSESLEDVLKEAWQKVTNSREEFSEGSPLLNYDSELPESAVTTEEVLDSVPIPAAINTTVQTSVKDSDSKGFWQASSKNVISRQGESYRKILSSKSSLKHAFVLKEILGEPVSIRRDGQ
tara:strand:- start:627 stop:1106 length:480 start_codon:yes stop_codon:yes gene_type:complete